MHKLKQVISICIGIILYIAVMEFILKKLLVGYFHSDNLYIILSVFLSFILFFVLNVPTFFICSGTALILMSTAFFNDSSEYACLSSVVIFLITSVGLCIFIFLFHLFLLLLLTFLTFIRLDKVFPVISRWNKIMSDIWDESEKQAESKNLYANGLKKSWFVFLFLTKRSMTHNPKGLPFHFGLELFKNLKKYLESNKDKN